MGWSIVSIIWANDRQGSSNTGCLVMMFMHSLFKMAVTPLLIDCRRNTDNNYWDENGMHEDQRYRPDSRLVLAYRSFWNPPHHVFGSFIYSSGHFIDIIAPGIESIIAYGINNVGSDCWELPHTLPLLQHGVYPNAFIYQSGSCSLLNFRGRVYICIRC